MQSQQDDEELAEIRNSSSLKLEEIPILGTNTYYAIRFLQLPYSGPHRVLSGTDKTITLDLGERRITVSIDRVKPTHIDIGSQVGTPQSSSPSPPGITHSSPAPHPATLPSSATTPLADPVITSPSSSTFLFAAHQPSAPLTSTSSVPTCPPLVPHPVITRTGRRVKFRDILDL
ncbi:hypothetical protein ACJJTC_013412 [Scirpophaga incertulas]